MFLPVALHSKCFSFSDSLANIYNVCIYNVYTLFLILVSENLSLVVSC